MMVAQRIRSVVTLLVVALLSESVLSAHARGNAQAIVASTNAECVGYYTLEMPGKFEYALPDKFSDGLSSWGSELRLNLTRLGSLDLLVSQPADTAELSALMDSKNAEQLRTKQELLRKADLFQAPDLTRDDLLIEAKAVPTFRPIRDAAIGASFGMEKFSLHALVNAHILSTTLPPQGTPEQTLDAFLSHYKPRALGEVPNGPGVCVPYGFFVGEQQPATIGLNIRLKEQPDIVVYLMAIDAATSQPWNPEEYIDRKTEPMSMFYASRGAVAMNRLRPYQRVSIDGQEGLGAFVNVKRDATLLQPVHNAATDSMDWGFLAYVPGKPGGKPGESFNITFKVERFGRFAKSPMTEKQFRELTQRIAASIKRRPGAWIPK